MTDPTRISPAANIRDRWTPMDGPLPPVGSVCTLATDSDGTYCRHGWLYVIEHDGHLVLFNEPPAFVVPGAAAGDYVFVNLERTALEREHMRTLQRLEGEMEEIKRTAEAAGCRTVKRAS